MKEAIRDVTHPVIRSVIGPIIGRTPSGGGNPPPPPSAPTVIAPPVIEGATEVGSILTLTSPGVFAGNPSPTVTGAWFKDAVTTGISTPTYTTAAAGSYEWRSTATNSEGSVTAASNVIAVVAAPVDDPYRELILSRSPLVWYRNNEPGGNIANDSSGNGLHGAYQAVPDVVLGDLGPAPNPHADVAGILYNQPGPGSDNVIEITSTTAGMQCLGVTIPVSATAFTIEQWSYPTNVAANDNMSMGVGLAGATAFAGIYAPVADQQTYFKDAITDNNDPTAIVSSSGLLSPNNTWRHTVGVVDGAVMKLYVDGVMVASSSIHVRPAGNATIFAMGYNYAYRTGAHNLGRYGDCMVYLHALSEAQIIENRNARLGITAGLIASPPEVIHDYKTLRAVAPAPRGRRRRPRQG